MQPLSVKRSTNTNENEVYDPVSEKIYFLNKGDLCVKSQRGVLNSQHTLPQHFQTQIKQSQTLRFKKIASNSIVFSPSGKALTCKSDKIHEVDMNMTFSKGVAIWNVSCSANCLSLIVGVRNIQKKKQYCLQFSIQHTTKITFKLDIMGKKLKAWVNKPLSIAQKKVQLGNQMLQWTPFIRVKGQGVSVFLSDLVEDPEKKVSIYNIFNTRNNNFQPTLKLSNKPLYKNTQDFNIKMIDQNTILLHSKQQIRLIRRSANEKQFNFNFNELTPEGLFYIEFNNEEIQVLKKIGFKIESEGLFIGKSIEDWTNWMISAFTLLDTNLHLPQTSQQLYLRTYEILLTKVESFKMYVKNDIKSSPALESDLEASWGYNQSLLPCPRASFKIPSSVKLNHYPPLKFQKQIREIYSTDHYLIVLLSEIQRVVVINREGPLFRVAEANLKKGFKKQIQLNQYQKELDTILSNNPNEPSIYKILKNCLKYADKVKLPEKQMKAIKQNALTKKQSKTDKNEKEKKSKKLDGLEPNASLVNTLTGMGFTQPESKKALIEAKNNLQKAIELILSKKMVIGTKITNTSISWDCQQCTFFNQDNTGTALVCAMCNFPRPPVTKSPNKEAQKFEQPKIEEPQPVFQEEVESQNIQTQLKKIFVWELGFAYCPLIIAGAFEKKIRFRLFGPNPKYYSMFYSKDEQFVDLTHLTIHDASHKIDQRPVRYQFYNSTTNTEQKQSAYSWISIEDEDIEINGVQNMLFKHIETTKDKILFQVKLEGTEGGQKFTKFYKGTILIERVYEEKKKSLRLEVSEGQKEEQQEKKNQIVEKKGEKIKIGCKEIPKNGYLQVRWARNQGRQQKLEISQQVAEVQEKIHQTSLYLPIIAAFEKGSAQVATLNSTLRTGQKPLILKNLNNNRMSIQYIVLEKVGKNPTTSSYKGTISFSEDPTKISISKENFKLEKGKKKFYIETKTRHSASYITIQLVADQKQNQSSSIEQISLVGLIGEQYERKTHKNTTKYTNINKLFKVKINERDTKQENKKFKIQTEVFNSVYDLNVLPLPQIEQTLDKFYKEGQKLDLRTKIYNSSGKNLQVESLSLQGWEIVKMVSHWSQEYRPCLLQDSYKQILQKFLETGDTSLIDTLIQQENITYLKTIVEGNYSLTKFLNTFVVGKPIQKSKRSKLMQFFQQLSPYLQSIQKSGNLDYVSILKDILENPETDVFNIELVFEIAKHFQLPEELLVKDLSKRIKIFSEKEKSNKMSQQQSTDSFNRRNLKQKHAVPGENILYNRYIVQNGKLYRKYTIDLVNVYRIEKILFNFVKSNKKTPFKIVIKSYDHRGNNRIQYEESYPEFVWEQLSISPYSEEFEKTVKESKRASKFNFLNLPLHHNITTRFLQIQISFTCHPNIGSTKDIQKIPQSEIIPEIYGQYVGQTTFSLPSFKNIEPGSLTFVKNLGGINKFNISTANNVYYYDNDQILHTKNENQVMANTKNQDNKSYATIIIELDQLISKGNDKYSEEFINILVNALFNLERGPLTERVALLLKKIAKTNVEIATDIFRKKLPNEFIFNSILKESALTQQKIIECLGNKPSNAQIQNAFYFIKNREDNQQELISKIVQHSLSEKKVDQTIILHEKNGWVPETTQILDLAIKEDKRKSFKSIISFCNNNKQLSNYCRKLLKEDGINQWFVLAFEELLKEQRKTKEDQVIDLLKEVVKHIEGLLENQENYDESELLQNFSMLASAINKLEIKDKELIASVISLFSLIPNKQSILSKFLSLKQFKNNEYTPQFITLCLKMLSNYLSPTSKNGQSLTQIYEILVFIFRNQNNKLSWANELSPQVFTAFCEAFSSIIIKEICYGGEQSSKIIDSCKRFKLSTIHCLANIIVKLTEDTNKLTDKFLLSQKCVRNLFKWILINTNISENESVKTTSTHFAKVQEGVWALLSLASAKMQNSTLKLFKEEFEKQEFQINKIKNIIYKKLYEKRLLNMCVKYLNKLEDDEFCHQLIEFMLKKFMDRVITKNNNELEILTENQKQDTDALSEKQWTNTFDLQNEVQSKPKDWLVHKNGAKNSVFKFDYPKTPQSSYEIVLRLKQNTSSINLSKILIGFEQVETTEENYNIPREISVEGGLRLDQLKFIGKMTEVPDSHYINYSVRVFGLNCTQVQANKLSSSLNKYPSIKYLKITFKSPQAGYITDALNLESPNKQKNLGSAINFLSVQGYSTNLKTCPEIENIQSFIKKISSFKHKQSLKKLFAVEENIKLFKDSLINLSILMKSELYAEDINKFIMRVCEVSTQIGNETIEKYLSLNNSQTCAKIVSEVILSNEQSLKTRIIILHNFITKNLSQSKTISLSLEPFLSKFSQIVYNVQKTKRLKISQIQLVFDTPSLCELIKSDSNSGVFAKYICTIMKLQPPFISSKLDHTKILKNLFQSPSELNNEALQALVVSEKNSRAWFMQNKCLETIYERTIKSIQSKSENIASLQKDLETLGSLCYNNNIKSIINKNKFNLQIFNLLVSEKYSGVLVGEKNNKLRETFVNFINRSVLGSENEKLVAEILKSSLTSSGIDQNKFFVGQVFLPILNSYSKTTLCVHPYDAEEKKILIDLNLKNTKESKQRKKISNEKKLNQVKYRLPTVLINNNTKNQVYQKIKQKCKFEGGSFNLVANHGNQACGIFDSITKAFTNSNQSILMLFKATPANQKSEVLGIFYKEQSSSRILPINWNENCVMFIVKQNQNVKFLDCSKQIGKKLVMLHEDDDFVDFYDDENYADRFLEINYDNAPFCQIYAENMYGSSYINFDIIRGTSYGTYIFQAAEYWLFEPNTPSLNQKQTQQVTLTNEILSLYNVSFFEPQFESRSILKHLRSDKIYEFPSSLSIRQLKSAFQIVKCKLKDDKENNLVIKTIDLQEIGVETSLQTLVKKDEDNPILDLLCEVNNLANCLDYSSSYKSKATDFLPKRGIMKHFEEINGVTSMIKVIKKSIESWKNKDRREKWYQYVLELERFSSFPHFFGMYLKDSETLDLLFKLLSGLPDTQQDKKWDELESKSTQKLLKIISEILSVDRTTEFREYAMKHDFFKTILERLKILTGQFKRQWKQIQEKEEEQVSPSKQHEDDGTRQIKKKKGVGYGNDGSSNTKWMKSATEAELNKEFQVIELILNIIENFIDLKHWKVPKKMLQNIYQSALLPYLEDALRAGTLLEISKHPTKFKLVFKILRTFSKNPNLVQILMPVHKNYHPRQTQSLQSLLKSLQSTATIFLSCLKPNSQSNSAEKISQQLAKDIIQTAKQVEEAIQEYVESHHDEGDENQMKNILEMPLDKKYRQLLKDLRFDYIDMKEGNKIKHHYSGNFVANYTPNQTKMIRLAQELADISTALPYEHTNAIFVRCDKDRVDFMQALIMGSNGTPYGHGAFLFDVYFDDGYPNLPPKVNLTTTGHGKVRFNPNLYACGKVCLSLLGTWRGSASENWDPKVSTLLQVLLSIQAIIMSEEVYFNEPGFEGQQGTAQGEKKNQAYSNIVRYCNIKFAMIDNMRNPPKGFENVIKRHFYLKQHEIMDECKKWLLYAEKRPANYVGLVNDHNNSWSTEFKKSKNQYKDMLEKAIEELQQEFNKLPVPSIHDITSKKVQKKQKKKKDNGDLLKKLEEETQQEIDVEYEKKDLQTGKQIDINDEKVKDRWSRYIGAMGIDAVSKQSKADILVFGLGPVALQTIKNVVLSGCRKLTIVDDKEVRWEDLSGGFFFTESDIGKRRTQSISYKIRELNIYVKVDTLVPKQVTEEIIKTYSLVFATQMSLKEQFKLNQQCRAHNVKFISAEFRSAYCRILNDFGQKFEVLDKNGEEPVEVIIKNITSAENGIVTLLDGSKHPYEDGEVVHIKNVEGMIHKEDKTKSINGTLHKVKVINSKSFMIGDTTAYEPYIRNGIAKNVKTPITLKYKNMKEVFQAAKDKLPLDENLQFYDFTKLSRNKLIHFCFVALDQYLELKNGKLPGAWDTKDADTFVEIFCKLYNEEITDEISSYVRRFSFTCSGYLPPLGAYFGGFISQEIIKAITQKYKPLDAVFFMDAQQIIPELPKELSTIKVENFISTKDHRDKGFEIVVGKQLLEQIKNSTSFMIGSGAIGCQLLKNFAMVGLGTGEKGKVTLTDPDHIENSNLNRQFLFRQKHISKPKSRTAAASILLMNPHLKGHISALLQRVSQSTKNIFSNKFFESLTFVANALDNVKARRYVDQRCVENKIPLFESGTLGPKGHTQVIIPYKTQSYGSQNDPVEEGEIPHCTLKMFPEETLHCIQWARDIFGKKFSLQPKAFNKIKDKNFKPEKDDIKSLNQCIVMATKGPKNFQDCIAYAVTKFYKYFRDDIMQLLYTYPLDAKTKDGEPFWKLPKRPPTPIMKFDPDNILHCTFIASMAVLVAKIYKIPYPKTFREEKERFMIGKQAGKIKIPDFVPSDEKAKSILKQTAAEEKKQPKMQQQEEKEVQMDSTDKNEMQLYQQFMKESTETNVQAQEFEKDNDQNGHIDFIYSMANLRAVNYKLDEMDWITTKIKAGRIVPALATTTTCVAGLQTLQICKYIRKLKLESMRNSFLNLAVPSLQMSEPGEVKKLKLNDKIEVNLWDRWDVPCTQNTTFGEVYKYLQEKYDLNPIGILQGMSRIDTAKGQQQKKEFLNTKLLDRLDKDENYIDIVVLFTKNVQQQKLVENVPPIRLRFQA